MTVNADSRMDNFVYALWFRRDFVYYLRDLKYKFHIIHVRIVSMAKVYVVTQFVGALSKAIKIDITFQDTWDIRMVHTIRIVCTIRMVCTIQYIFDSGKFKDGEFLGLPLQWYSSGKEF
ncbi:hypothetical protein EVAR_36456_1 [Eumeta japonica]|uniref:Uncharacterized protein n=1 Tax=Eumeta variegata TaxID=151549 RepID=A0A4C1VQA4_EUMVA|nr:hypothetical protein EVAR_36456_1 [Eumeta japonica]